MFFVSVSDISAIYMLKWDSVEDGISSFVLQAGLTNAI